MIGKLIGAIAGSKLAETTKGLGGPSGAALGVGAAMIAKRLSLPTLIAVTAGGYFFKKHLDKKDEISKTPDMLATRQPPVVEPNAI
ncbi:hypothetical protein [Altererythrobacter aquiaggeris]|uniref:hypothetical protein n=1 Tax=Aestuarierythrobacter aquiaggeris TaxID=1898396 RepID=UPI003017DC99